MATISNNKYNDYAPNALTGLLIKDKITVDDLEPKNNNHLQAVIDYYKTNHSKLKDISSETEYRFLLNILRKDYTYFAYLDRKQYRNDIAQQFLIGLFQDPKYIKKDDNRLSSYLSFDEKIVFLYDYETRKGDEIYYFDSELQVPASLISKFKTTIKVEEPVEFVKMLDVSVRFLEPTHVINKLYYICNTSFRKVMYDMVGKDGVGYYKATNSMVEIEKATTQEINTKFPQKCAAVTSLAIKSIDVDREVRDKIEDEFFELRRKRINIDEELKYQKDSMELFAKKLELLHKYSASPELLTEAEKDKAFDRYARKGKIAYGDKRSSSSLHAKTDDKLGDGIELEEDHITTEHKSIFFWLRLIGGVVSGLVAFILLVSLMVRGYWAQTLIGWGVIALVYGGLLVVTAIIERKKGSTIMDNIKEFDDVSSGDRYEE